MDPQVRAEFDELRAAHLRAMERMDRAEKRMEAFDKRMDLAEKRAELVEKRMGAGHERAERRMELADKRMDKFDAQLQAMRKLMQAGIKLANGLAADTRELKRSQKAFLDSFRNGRNGHAHKG